MTTWASDKWGRIATLSGPWPIGVLAMVAGLALLRDSRVPQAPRLDPGGIGLATLALLLSSEKIAGLG
jgi:hypothetical protein